MRRLVAGTRLQEVSDKRHVVNMRKFISILYRYVNYTPWCQFCLAWVWQSKSLGNLTHLGHKLTFKVVSFSLFGLDEVRIEWHKTEITAYNVMSTACHSLWMNTKPWKWERNWKSEPTPTAFLPSLSRWQYSIPIGWWGFIMISTKGAGITVWWQGFVNWPVTVRSLISAMLESCREIHWKLQENLFLWIGDSFLL